MVGKRSATDGEGQPLFTPPAASIEASQLTAFSRRLEDVVGRCFADDNALQAFSLAEPEVFWRQLLLWLDLPTDGTSEPARTSGDVRTARFFPNLRLNYAESLLQGDDDALAVIGVRDAAPPSRLTRGQLRERVLRLMAGLQAIGLKPGDPVAAVIRNDPDAVVAVLAAAAVGATIATAAPDMGAEILAERLGALKPVLLIAATEPRPHDAGAPAARRVADLAARLPTLRAVVALDGGAIGTRLPVYRAADLSQSPPGRFERFDFNQPLFVLFSSGTTGRPKGFVHGAGGALLEHLKEHRLHGDLRRGERMFFQTSPAWMMWHWQLSALGAGAAIVTYDGPAPGPETLWRIAEETQVNVLGTSPPYLRLCQNLGVEPGAVFDLGALRAILSTGSILQPGQGAWVRDAVKAVPVQSISGGSDIIGCFVLGHPHRPCMDGEAQSISLGLDVRAAGDSEGELICAAPFPSRPLGLLDDADGARFRAAYFSRHGSAWGHGDLIALTSRGGVIMRGRMDGVLNVRGVRIGPAEIYAVLHGLPEIAQALAVEQAGSAPVDERMVLLVVPSAGAPLDPARIRRVLAEKASAAHVPDIILAVKDLPATHSGKLSEAAAAEVVNGRPAANMGALRNPESLEAIRAALQDVSPVASGDWLADLWSTLLQCGPVGPNDNFFDLGGHSLAAARVLAEVRRRTGRSLDMATLLHAPTPQALHAAIDNPDWSGAGRVVQMNAATSGAPLFLIHSMTGNVLQLHRLVRELGDAFPVYGVQARGLDMEAEPLDSVEAMAEDYIAAIRSVQAHGPYRIAGFSFGGLVAFEMARRLQADGETVSFLGLLDSRIDKRLLPPWQKLQLLGVRVLHHLASIARLSPREALAYLSRRHDLPPESPHAIPPHIVAVRDAILEATRRYKPGRYGGKLSFIKAEVPATVNIDPSGAWKSVARTTVVVAPGDHDTMIEAPHVEVLASILRERLLNGA